MALFTHLTSLPSTFTAVTGGGGGASVSGSELDITRPSTTDVGYVYYNDAILPIDEDWLWQFTCINNALAGAKRPVTLWQTTAPGTAVSFSDFLSGGTPQARTGIEWRSTGGDEDLTPWYINSSGSFVRWNHAGQAWTTTASAGKGPEVQEDNYCLFAIENDGTNERFRWIIWTMFEDTGSYDFNNTMRIVTLTDWVNWSSVLSGQDNLRLVLGVPINDTLSGDDISFEFVIQEDGTKEYGLWNGRTNTTDNYDIRAGHSFGNIFVPVDRTSIAVNLGSGGSWDDVNVKNPMMVLDGANYRGFYDGDGGSGYSIGAMTATDPEGTWTKDGGNPVVTAPTGYDSVQFPYVVKDENEPDSDKRWKMLCAGIETTTNLFHILYFTAPSYNGTWTYESAVLEEGSSGADDELGCSSPCFIWDNNQWVVFYSAKRQISSQNTEDTHYATGPSLESLAKQGTFLTWRASGGATTLSANMTGRVATVNSTTGFAADAFVGLTDDNTGNNNNHNRVQSVDSSTQLTLYQEQDGFNSGDPIYQIDTCYGMYIQGITGGAGAWKVWATIYRWAQLDGSFSIYHEGCALLTSTETYLEDAAEALTWEHLHSPFIHCTDFGHERAAENIALVTLPIDRVITVAIGQATETDASQAMSGVKTRAIGQAAETDESQAMSQGAQTVAINQASEADTAQAMSGLKTLLMGQASEADAAQAFSGLKTRAISQVAETDAAQAVTWSPKIRLAGQAVETDLAQAMSAAKTLAMGQANESDLAQAFSGLKARAIGQAVETDLAQVMTPLTALVIGQALETDLAQAVSGLKALLIGQASESDLAQVMSAAKALAMGQASETDAAQSFSGLKTRAIGQAVETDTALSVSEPGAQIILIGLATETDAAQAMSSAKALLIGQASESDLAQAFSGLKTRAIGQVSESDLAQVMSAAKTLAIGQASEVDAAQSMLWSPKIRLIGQAEETDVALAIAALMAGAFVFIENRHGIHVGIKAATAAQLDGILITDL